MRDMSWPKIVTSLRRKSVGRGLDYLPYVLSTRASRRSVLGALAFGLSGCMTYGNALRAPSVLSGAAPPVAVPQMYQALLDEGIQVPPVDVGQVDAKFWRRVVDYDSAERIGTLIVDTPAKYLYHIKAGGRATRYGIGVGREGFAWSGRAVVAYGRKWPRWVPPASMIERQPELRKYSVANGGMGPGLSNPLGARALYIHDHGKDTLYRLHGTNEPPSIGIAVSSGCIRLLSQDVIHLYDNVQSGSQIIVFPDASGSAGLTLERDQGHQI